MIPLPPALTSKLVLLGVSTVLGTVVPFALQDRPRLLWVWDKIGPRVVVKVKDQVDDRLRPPKVEVPTVPVRHVTPAPIRWDDDVVVEGACINPHDQYVEHRQGPLNPRGLCRQHWWTAGPVRAVVSFPFRLFRGIRCR